MQQGQLWTAGRDVQPLRTGAAEPEDTESDDDRATPAAVVQQ